MITACHNCRRGIGKHCETCNRVSQDDIRIQHTPHNKSELQAAMPQAASEQATGLPSDIEDKLRQFLFDLFDLDPIQLLLLQHIRRHGTPVSFRHYFAKFLKASIKYGDRAHRERWEQTVDEIGANIGRATTKAIWEGMLRKMPVLAIFQTWDKGHGGRQASEEPDEPRHVQEFFDFGEE
jgi:hypothetical protein